LSMHNIVTKINSKLELLENKMSYLDVIDDNGNIIIQHYKTFPTLAQGLIFTAKRKQLRRTMKEIAAYNIAKNTNSESDVRILEVPHSLYVLQEIIVQHDILFRCFNA
jgi:hypothetical protein